MERTWKPTTSGILSILVGACTILSGILVAVYVGFWMLDLQAPMLGFLLLPLLFILPGVFGIVGIIGGYFALRRRRWGLALAGAICVIIVPLTFIILGDMILGGMTSITTIRTAQLFCGIPAIMAILAIIFIALSKREFA